MPKYCEYCGSHMNRMLSIKHCAQLLDTSTDFIRAHIARGTIGTVVLKSTKGSRNPIRVPASELGKLLKGRPGMDSIVNDLLLE